MKRFLWLPLAMAACVYGTGAVKMSESSADRFLNELETLSLQGKSADYCARLHKDLTVSIRDHTSPEMPRDFDGGKAQFCDYVSTAARAMALIGPETRATRENFLVTRSWLHPWTARVSYHESRTTRFTRVNATLDTVSDDQWILVFGFDGLKVLGLASESRAVER